MRPSWNEYFMLIAKIVSTRSTCNSRPTGAVIVRDKQILSTGFNGSVSGSPHCTDEADVNGEPFCLRRAMNVPENDKYNYCRSAHAEANAIALASRFGISLNQSTIYVTLAPCYVCFKLLTNAGIKRIYYEYGYESTDKARDVFWKNAIEEARMEKFEQLGLSQGARHSIENALNCPTSVRRLGENRGVATSDCTHGRNDVERG